MSDHAKAKLFKHGRGQAVRLPDALRLPGTEVTVSRVGQGVLLKPVKKAMSRAEIEAIFAELDRLNIEPFMPDGREQPPMPEDDKDFTFD